MDTVFHLMQNFVFKFYVFLEWKIMNDIKFMPSKSSLSRIPDLNMTDLK